MSITAAAGPKRTGLHITVAEYRRYTAVQWAGTRCITTRDLFNGSVKIPAGTVVTITHKRSWFEIEAPKCDCCGLYPRMTRVKPENLQVTPIAPAPENE